MPAESGAAAGSGRVAGKPRARTGLSLQEVGEEGLLYDREEGMVHILNRTALFAWRQCDGTRTGDEIASLLQGTFQGSSSVDIRRDVHQILSNFAERGLLEEA